MCDSRPITLDLGVGVTWCIECRDWIDQKQHPSPPTYSTHHFVKTPIPVVVFAPQGDGKTVKDARQIVSWMDEAMQELRNAPTDKEPER